MSYVRSKCASFEESDFSTLQPPSPSIAIVTPLIGEFPESALQLLKTKCGITYVCLDVQGFTRQLTDSGTVTQGDWKNKHIYLPSIDILKIDNKESEVLFGTRDLHQGSTAALSLGVKYVVATSAEGVLFSCRKADLKDGKAQPSSSSSSVNEEDCIFEWREWKQPRTPECRTGRGLNF